MSYYVHLCSAMSFWPHTSHFYWHCNLLGEPRNKFVTIDVPLCTEVHKQEIRMV